MKDNKLLIEAKEEKGNVQAKVEIEGRTSDLCSNIAVIAAKNADVRKIILLSAALIALDEDNEVVADQLGMMASKSFNMKEVIEDLLLSLSPKFKA